MGRRARAFAAGSSGCQRTPMRRSFGMAAPFGTVIGSLSRAGVPATRARGAGFVVSTGTSTWTPIFASDGMTGSALAGTATFVSEGRRTCAAGGEGTQTSER